VDRVRDVNIVDVFRRHAQAFKPLILVLPMSWEQANCGSSKVLLPSFPAREEHARGSH
jgi:hypothetical protein